MESQQEISQEACSQAYISHRPKLFAGQNTEHSRCEIFKFSMQKSVPIVINQDDCTLTLVKLRNPVSDPL